VPGDLTICAYCTAVLQFTDDLSMHVMSESELEALNPFERASIDQALKLLAKVR
jgi:hypothetical protein